MTLENAKTLHKHFLEIGRLYEAQDLEKRFPELVVEPEPPKEEPKVVAKAAIAGKENVEPKKNGKIRNAGFLKTS